MLLVENIQPDAPLHDRLVARQQAAVDIVADGIRRGQADGRYRSDLDPATKAVEILAFVNGMETSWLLDPSLPLAAGVQGIHGVAGARLRSDREELDMRYRLDVVAPSVAEVVRNAGGWLFDRVMAGWDVTVMITGDDDIRPLQILGVDTADLETVMRAVGGTAAPADAWRSPRTSSSATNGSAKVSSVLWTRGSPR